MEIAKYRTLSTNALYMQHKNDKKHKNDTASSNFLWDLKENHSQIPKLTWSIVRFACGYSNNSKRNGIMRKY